VPSPSPAEGRAGRRVLYKTILASSCCTCRPFLGRAVVCHGWNFRFGDTAGGQSTHHPGDRECFGQCYECKAFPTDPLKRIGGVERHLVAPLIRARRCRKAAFNHQPNFSANWISLFWVLVALSLPAVAIRAPVASKISVRPRAIDGTSKFA
jgi:hypothetical protein